MITPEDRKRIEYIREWLRENELQMGDTAGGVKHNLMWLLDLVERQEAALAECAIVLEVLHAEGGTGIQPDIERAVMMARAALGIGVSS